MTSFLSPLLQPGQPPLALTNRRNNRIVAATLIIAPTSAIHTFAMRFTIDVIFVSKEGRVLKVRPHVKPRRIAAAWRAFAVVELPAGTIEHSDTRAGDRLQIATV